MDEGYYQEYFRLEREHWWFRARSNILAAEVARLVPRGRAILNIGAAMGASSEMLARFGAVTSVEYEKNCCDFVAKQFGKTFINASITHLPFPTASFDLVCAFDVIEHVEDDVRAVAEMVRVCRPGGLVMITVPAFKALWSHHDVVNHHVRRYRLSQLKQLLSPAMSIVRASYFNAILFLPILCVRLAAKVVPQRWIRRGAGSDFTLANSRLLDNLLYGVLNLENAWLRKGLSFPLGVSILVSCRKGESATDSPLPLPPGGSYVVSGAGADGGAATGPRRRIIS